MTVNLAPCLDSEYRNTLLLDMTPGSPDGRRDSPLPVGKTFSDLSSDLNITSLGRVEGEPDAIDVVVNVGPFPKTPRR